MTALIAGLLNLHKPVGPTSSQMVGFLRRVTKIEKIGHAGTLDPLASGVLPICVGKAVRLSEYLLNDDKVYGAEVTFGIRTNTDDGEGHIIAQRPADFSRETLAATLAHFVGVQEQVPPDYAAIKVAGKPMYQRARRGEVMEVAPRRVVISRLTLLDWRAADGVIRVQLEIACGKGTYIRALARDLGERIGCGAYLSALSRTQCGAFKLNEAVTPEALEKATDWQMYLLPMDFGLQGWPAVNLSAAEAQRIRNGLTVDAPRDEISARLMRAYDEARQFFAILKYDEGQQRLKPEKVFF